MNNSKTEHMAIDIASDTGPYLACFANFNFSPIHRVTIGCYRRTSRLSRDYRGYRAYCARQIVDFEAAQ